MKHSPICHAAACVILLLLATVVSAQPDDYLRIHREATVADGHNDVLGRVLSGDRIDIRGVKGHSDLPRFREGGMDIQVFSVWVHPNKGDADGWEYALREIDTLTAIARRIPSRLRVARSSADVREAAAAGALAGIIGLEGSTCIDSRPERLRQLHARGLRVFAPTWNHSVSWATSSADEWAGKTPRGLTPHGRRLIRLLDTLNIILDVSHLGAQAISDALAETKNPVIASHSSCASLREHHRNLTDDQLRAIASRGGVVMINYFPAFNRAGMTDKLIELTRVYAKKLDDLAKKHPRRDAAFLTKADAILREAVKKGVPTLHDVADHIDHAVATIGAQHVGLGSDFDGINYAPAGLHDVTWLPMLTRELLRRGHSEADVKAILGGNFARVFRQVCGS